jgi:hypothetical protein
MARSVEQRKFEPLPNPWLGPDQVQSQMLIGPTSGLAAAQFTPTLKKSMFS